jgi:hypothetical protein
MLILASLSGIGAYSAVRVHQNGIEFGKQVGRCEMVCAIYEADFVALNEGCQCETAWNFVFTIRNPATNNPTGENKWELI